MKKTLFLLFTLLSLLSCLALPVLGAEAPEQVTEETAEPTEEEAVAPLSGAFLSFLDENGSTLLSATGVIVSLLLAFLYKSGLLPLVSKGLSAISASSDKAAGMTAEFTEKATEALCALEEHASAALSHAEETEAVVKSTESILTALGDALTEAKAERDRIALVLSEETALFYELLNSVKLPEAQKEVIRTRYYKYQSLLDAMSSPALSLPEAQETAE